MSSPGRGMRYRSSFAWNLLGNTLYSASQWLLIVVLARLTYPEMVGSFALMLAISAPVFLTVGMNLRTLQITDFERAHSLSTFYFLRHIQNLVASSITIIAGYAFGLDGSLMVALAVLCIAKSVESYSQSTYGYFQVMRRLDLVSQSLIIRSITGPVLFATGLLWSGQLAGGVGGLVIAWAATQLAFDRRMAARLLLAEGRTRGKSGLANWSDARPLLRDGGFLGIDQGVSSLSVNLPRYAVDAVLGALKLGIYSAQAYFAQIITMIASAMAGVLMPELVESFHKKQTGRFLRLLGFLVLFSTVVFIAGVVGAILVGDQFISWALGPEYVQRALLVWLMASAGAATLHRVLSKALEASRKFASYLWIDIATAAAIAVLMFPLIRVFGLPGAAMAMVCGYMIGCLLFSLMLIKILREMNAGKGL